LSFPKGLDLSRYLPDYHNKQKLSEERKGLRSTYSQLEFRALNLPKIEEILILLVIKERRLSEDMQKASSYFFETF